MMINGTVSIVLKNALKFPWRALKDDTGREKTSKLENSAVMLLAKINCKTVLQTDGFRKGCRLRLFRFANLKT